MKRRKTKNIGHGWTQIKTDTRNEGQKALPGLESAEDKRGQERETEVKGKKRKENLTTERHGKRKGGFLVCSLTLVTLVHFKLPA